MAKKKRRPLLKFPRRMQKKLIVMFTIVAGMLIGLIGRLMYIEYTSGEKYEKIVLSQQEYDSKVIPYQRGDIVDAKGTVMATSIAVYNVILDCSVLTSDEDYVAPTIQALVQCFPDLSSDDPEPLQAHHDRLRLRIIRGRDGSHDGKIYGRRQEEPGRASA